MKIPSKLLTLCGVLTLSLIANAGTITTYSGQDDGASATGPWPLSAAAQASLLAAAGPTNTLTFESLTPGYSSTIAAAPGVSITLTGLNYGPGFSGVTNITDGNLYGFNTTSGGSNWLGFAGGSATFNFASPVTAFGFYLTGVQLVFTSTIPVTFNDGTAEALLAPVNVNGGAAYFGFTDVGGSTSSITIADISNDAWGIDDVSYSAPVVTPEPGTFMLIGSGLLALAGAIRRKIHV